MARTMKPFQKVASVYEVDGQLLGINYKGQAAVARHGAKAEPSAPAASCSDEVPSGAHALEWSTALRKWATEAASLA